LIDLAKKAFPASESKNTSKKVKHVIWKLQIWMTRISIEGSRTRFQRTNRHSGGDQEQGPWIIVKWFVTTVTMNDSVSRWKTKL
jgi:hypothetical protein